VLCVRITNSKSIHTYGFREEHNLPGGWTFDSFVEALTVCRSLCFDFSRKTLTPRLSSFTQQRYHGMSYLPVKIVTHHQALAQDQRVAVQNLLSSCPGLEGIQVAAYDGDTPQEDRRKCVGYSARLPAQEIHRSDP